jgi:hypothetical protein
MLGNQFLLLLLNQRQDLDATVCSTRMRGMCRGDGMKGAETPLSSSGRSESRDTLEAKPQ